MFLNNGYMHGDLVFFTPSGNSAFLTEYVYLLGSGKGFQLMAGQTSSPLHGPPTDLKGLEKGNSEKQVSSQ